MTPNMLAFLSMIATSEGTDRIADPYRCTFGYRHVIADLSDHPAITGEWMGVPLDFLGPAYAGLVSTAAGKYQITKHTWEAAKVSLALKDFTGPSQDDAAILLIKQKDALDLVNSGQVQDAISACASIWASLPGSASGQPQAKIADLIHSYANAGGAFA